MAKHETRKQKGWQKEHRAVTSFSTTEKLRFSFEYYDTTCDDYCLSKWPPDKVRNAILKLQDICTKSFNQMRVERSVYHFGEVFWEKTNKPKGFPDPRVNLMSPFHFALIGVNGQLARVFGAYQAGTFYIVWFDLNHEIWPSLLRHT